ncbi:MAG: hypothetical protein ACXWG8_02645 [Usitatibacter sp.]
MPELTISCLSTVPSRDSGIDAVQCLFQARQIRVRELIALAVREQCAQLSRRHAADLSEAACRLARQYLTAADIADQTAAGRVVSGVREPAVRKGLDVEREIAVAMKGFEQGAYIVLVGEHRCTSLDESVILALTQPVHFIRMLPLAGG